jgi:hypothetical protein
MEKRYCVVCGEFVGEMYFDEWKALGFLCNECEEESIGNIVGFPVDDIICCWVERKKNDVCSLASQ